MGQTPGDDKQEPSLELPDLSLPGLGRRRRSRRQKRTHGEQPSPGTASWVEASAAGRAAAPPAGQVEEPTEPLAAQEQAPAYERTEPVAEPDQPAPEATEPLPVATAARARAQRRGRTQRAPRTAPPVTGRVAAGVTGLVVGAVGGAGTWGALAGCEAVRGVSTCGGGPGLLILVAIVVLMVLAGAGLLRFLAVASSGSTSFLAVGIVAVLVMMLLLDVIFSPWMFLVVPVLSAAAYLVSYEVTTRYAEEDTGRRDWR